MSRNAANVSSSRQSSRGSHGKYSGYLPPRASAHWLPCLEPGKGKEENVLVVTDHFTWYAQAYITQSQMAQTMAKVLWDNFIIHYRLPEKILLDQGRNFESELITDLWKLTGTTKLGTSLYHTQMNGQYNRFNSTLINMLSMLPLEHKSDWKGSIKMLLHAYNCAHSCAMGFSPYFLMYGRQPWFPIDVTLGTSPKPIVTSTSSEYIQKLRTTLSGPTRRLTSSSRRKCNAISKIMSDIARQCP